ncbi:MAG TPA: phenylalanine--tRNA ligase subunit beta [Caldisericia bacterium]|nr:phenylalanine--tRNA ligase subunit beta [Caldisericia bacterium]HPF49027.1 phenylalanine--tRNA ligase subunit beta [Caldisericia bacterium]HPI83109.1 phenylalanine--tRNA ligase subunit beta [Caldisericia bacterium]HPQ92336.1 phenylalanine--tRNA ligase subunit beta [Caldisericia bacterium]HRV74566.1 phenylalanine--tRNA ligase subunit beta [Caldisericia bacterium]
MILSMNFLKSIVPWDITSKEIVDGFTMLGLEVESYHKRHNVDKCVIGIIKELTPVTEKLQLAKTQISETEIIDIVTNSKTVAVSDKVPVVLVGGMVGDLKITERKLQGTASYGMFLTSKDFLISGEHLPVSERESVWKLPDDAPEFTNPNETMWLSDEIIEIKITPNHPEWLCLEGLIREVALVMWWKTGKTHEIPELPIDYSTLDVSTADSFKIEIQDGKDCPNYTGVLADVSVKPSGFEMRKRLLAAGLRPINNVVDASNLAMYYTNQPTHAFDADTLKSGVVRVASIDKPMQFVTLDDVKRDLPAGTMMIWDGDKPIAVAGIMGGTETEVTNSTKRIFLESASFYNMKISESVSKIGLRSDASSRFEKGCDITSANRTAFLVMNLIGTKPQKKATVAAEYNTPTVTLRTERMKHLLGYMPEIDKIKTGLSILGLSSKGDSPIEFSIPGNRAIDLATEIDLIEEAVRVTGYDKVPSTLPQISLSPIEELPGFAFETRIKRILAGFGLNECYTLPFTSADELNQYSMGSHVEKAVNISNPLTSDSTHMRPTLEIGILKTATWNIRQSNTNLTLFEVGGQYNPETRNIAILLTGENQVSWDRKNPFDFYDMKGLVEDLLSSLGISDYELIPSNISHLHPYRQVEVRISGNGAGYFGQLHPDTDDTIDSKHKVYVANIDVLKLMEAYTSTPKTEQISKFPPILRDISVIAANDVLCADITDIIKDAAGAKLEAVNLFDVFTSEEMKQNKQRSLSFSLVFVDNEGTMKGEEIDTIIEQVSNRLKQKGVAPRMG